MSKHINFKGLSKDTVNLLSAFVNADYALKRLKAEYKEDNSALEATRDKILSDRKEYLEQFPHNVEEARSKFSTVEIDAKIKARRDKYLEDCKPFKEQQRPAVKWVPETMYYGYLMAVQSGSLTAKVNVVLTKTRKGQSTSEEVKLDKSYHDLTVAFLREIGIDYSGSKDKVAYDRAISKFADLMAHRTNGMKRSNEIGEFVKNKSEREFANLWVLAFVSYLINDLGIYKVVANATNTAYTLERVAQ